MEMATNRPLANFHPNIWGDRFLIYTPPSSKVAEEACEKLKEEVKRELKEASNNNVELLKMVDAIQRLGIEYHFEEEIDQLLQKLFEKIEDFCKDNDDLYTLSLAFRLLRQNGYRVSCKIFDKFKNDEGGFRAPSIDQVKGVLEFFEATHLRVHNEDILDEANIFTRSYLESVLPSLENPVAEQVHHALHEYSNRRGYTRLEARHYISIYHQFPSHHQGLLNLAKLDFNLLQSMHKRELSELYRWWKDLDAPKNFPFARDRMVESYFWALGVCFEPKYDFARKILSKMWKLGSVLDDIYDAYGTFEELQLFTDAIESWSFSCLEKLPEPMKICCKAVLESFQDFEDDMIKRGAPNHIKYGIEAVKVIARDYLEEVKWREEKYKPKSEEYLQVATKSCAFASLIILSFLGMGDIVTKEAFDFVLSEPKVVRASKTICRLTADIVGHEGLDHMRTILFRESRNTISANVRSSHGTVFFSFGPLPYPFEREREHIPSVVECYMEEHNVTKSVAVAKFKNRIEAGWKDTNEAFLKPTQIPVPLLYRILNFARGMEVIYSKGDWYTRVGPEMQNFITQLLIDPIP